MASKKVLTDAITRATRVLSAYMSDTLKKVARFVSQTHVVTNLQKITHNVRSAIRDLLARVTSVYVQLFREQVSLAIIFFVLSIFSATMQAQEKLSYKLKAALEADNGTVTIADINNLLEELNFFPESIKRFILDIHIRNAKETEDNFYEGAIFYRNEQIGTAEIRFEPYAQARDRGAVGIGQEAVSITFQFPQNWRVEKVIPDIMLLTKAIKTDSPALVLSSYRYQDEKRGVLITRGLTLVSGVELSGPFVLLNKMIGKVSILPGVQYKGRQHQRLLINVKPKVKDSYVAVVIPLYIKANFKELYDNKKIKTWPKPFKSIATDGFMVSIDTRGELAYRTTMILDMSTRDTPLRIDGRVTLKPNRVSFTAQVDELNLGPEWLEFKQAGVGIAIDYPVAAVTAAVGIPFTGLGLRGRVGLCCGDKGIKLQGLGYAEVRSDGFSPIVLEGEVDNVQLSAFIDLFAQMVYKDMPHEFPETTLKKLHMYVAPESATVFDREYSRGVYVDSDVTIFGKRGNLNLLLKPGKTGKMVGAGHIEDIKTPIISLTNVAFDINLSLKRLPRFLVSGKLAIPPLLFSQEVDIELRKTGGYIKVAGTPAFGLYGELSLLIDVKKIAEFQATLELTPHQFIPSITKDFNDYKKTALKRVDQLKRELNKGIDLVVKGA